jgi:aminobenzoyl-glutamate transport protein
MSDDKPAANRSMTGILGFIEWLGNKLPDPAILFVWALLIVWVVSAWLAGTHADIPDPRTGKPLEVYDQLTGKALIRFLVDMVHTFVSFPPLGVVLVALLGVGVAEHTGFINALIKGMLSITPSRLITPMLLLVGIISHSAGDTGYVLVVPLGGVIFQAAGRHPLAGIVAGFAAVSGGFSANFVPSGLDPLLQGLTQSATDFVSKTHRVDVLCNYYFMAISSVLIIGVGWFITDWIIEPRLRRDALVDGDLGEAPKMDALSPRETRALWVTFGVLVAAFGLFLFLLLHEDSLLQEKVAPPPGGHGRPDRAVMQMIIPLIFLFFLIPGVVYGYLAGTVQSHRDIVKGMTKSMSTMGYYLVLAFFASLFTYAFRESNLGALTALKGARFLKEIRLPPEGIVIGVILITTSVNLLIGSASAKWALLAPIFVPMLMEMGLSPELTQAAYRVGDSSTNIITPLMPYFPLVVTFAQRYVKTTGIGTLIALMLPYSLTFLVTWTGLLMIFWQLGLPLGDGVSFTWPAE